MSAVQQLVAAIGTSEAPPGQVEYTTPGSYSWECPAGVTSVSVVAVGPGGNFIDMGGGGLGYKNNIPVIPGNFYAVEVGNTTTTYFISAATVSGQPGVSYTGGSFTGDGGGNGGSVIVGSNDYNGGGGGAGGYSGNGGNGSTKDIGTSFTGSHGAGGGGGGGGNNRGGGGVGIKGEGVSGTGGGANTQGNPGSGGVGANYGGGLDAGNNGTRGAGALRIIWPGNLRSFPSTRTADE